MPEDKEIKRGEGGRFLKGTKPGPGHPRGNSIKEQVRNWLEDHPEDMADFIKHFVKRDRSLAWQMLEGRPPQDITSGGERIIPIPILNVPANNGDQKDLEAPKENPGDTGGNIGQQDNIDTPVADSSSAV